VRRSNNLPSWAKSSRGTSGTVRKACTSYFALSTARSLQLLAEATTNSCVDGSIARRCDSSLRLSCCAASTPRKTQSNERLRSSLRVT
jgi:hypothetical protein